MRRSLVVSSGMLLGAVTALLLLSPEPARPADDPPASKTAPKPPDIAPPTEKELANKRMVFMKSALAHFEIQVGDRKDPGKVGDPCLRWTDPVSNSTDGIVAVYAQNGGRPDALGQMFINFQKRWITEFTIIPDSGVTIMRSGREFWKPAEYVCKFADLPKSPVPAGRPALRLPQMRAIAADFSVLDHFGVNPVDVNLRLLPQPVYRYAEEGKIVDGAVFVFAHGTNPECCILLEAYQDDKGSRYRYAVAPMSIYRLETKYKNEIVWTIERRNAGPRSREYYANGYVPEPGEDLPD